MRDPTTSRARSPRVLWSRRAALAGALAVVCTALVARGDEVGVPVRLQAELLAKVAGYDRNMAARAGDRVRVLIVFKQGDADSQRTAAQLQSALGGIDRIADLPHEERQVAYEGARALTDACRAQRIAIVYLAAGFDRELDELRAAFDGVSVLTVSAVGSAVPRGIVLGFDLVSGKPKLLVNLGQARRQSVAFRAEVLKIMKVYE